ncbi:hypothetical protein [Streptosporangium sp. NPDC004631]
MAGPANMRVSMELGATAVRPGHTLVVATARRLSMEGVDNLKARLRAELPGVEIVILPEVLQVLVYENDEGGEASDGRSRAHSEES